MPRGIPSSIIRKLYQKNIDTAFLTVLTVYYSGNVLRLVNNEEDIEYKGNTYTATRFTIVLPDDSPDSVPVSSVVFADINNTFIDIVRNIDELDCDVEMIAVKTNASISIENDGSNDYYETTRTFDVYETKVGPYQMRLSSASSDIGTTSFTISYDDIGQYTFPERKFSSYDFPLLY